MIVGVGVLLILPNSISTASFLRKEERAVALQRLRGVKHGTGDKEKYGPRELRIKPEPGR